MTKIQFSNGTIVTFKNPPTPEDINEAGEKLGIKPKQQESGKPGYMERLSNEYKTVIEETPKGIQSGADIARSEAERLKEMGVNPVSANIAGLQTGGARGALSAAVNAGRAVFAPITAAVSPYIEKGIDKISDNEAVQDFANTDIVGGALDKIDAWKEENPEKAKVLGEIRDLILMLSGEKAIKKGGQVASDVKGTAGDVAQKAKVVGEKVKVGTGEALDKSGSALYKSAIPLSKQEAKLMQNYKAKTTIGERLKGTGKIKEPITAGVTAMEKGFMGTESMIGIQAKRVADTLWKDKVKPALKNVKGDIKTSEVIDSVLDKIIKKVKEPGRQSSLLEGLEALADDYKNIPKMSHQFAQDIKSDLYKFIPDKVWKGKPVASALRDVQAMFAQELRLRTRRALKNNKEALKAFDEYGNLKGLMEFGQTAMSGGKKKGGFGGFVTSLYENATIPIKTTGGLLIKGAGNLLKK
jgi:signal recognition particle subunit SEC65